MENVYDRFLSSQSTMRDQITSELKNGKKVTHWIWFVFPQLADLGQSTASKYYGITDIKHAVGYLNHYLLGPQLLHDISLLLVHTDKSIEDMLGTIDALKLKSCLTLFSAVVNYDKSIFDKALHRFYNGEKDQKTLDILGKLTAA